MENSKFVNSFINGLIEPQDFTHREHIRAAFCLLKNKPFLESCIAMRDGLKILAFKAGKPNLYHETITVAFMAIISERISSNRGLNYIEFMARNDDLTNQTILGRYYSKAALESTIAREQFLLEDSSKRKSMEKAND